MLSGLFKKVAEVPDCRFYGEVSAVKDPLIECCGLEPWAEVGDVARLINKEHNKILCEIIEVTKQRVLLLPFHAVTGVTLGSRVELGKSLNTIAPDSSWLGRVINGIAEPVDGKGPLLPGVRDYSIYAEPPLSSTRRLVREKLDLGVRTINAFAPCCKGQRMGIFSGSGIGKSLLLSMCARFAKADIKVIGLIGERSREVQELLSGFMREHLQDTIVVVATGDEAALMRKHASYLTMALCEYFRDQGLEVLCIMDSITRFAAAQREIGLLRGELPTTRGYTPSVFTHLPKLLERAGGGAEGQGNITGLFSVLVEGDDHNGDPIADSVRSILDGHLVLDRSIAESGRFPAVNILRSVSRSLPLCNDDSQNQILSQSRKLLSTYASMKDMINLGIYKQGSDVEIDRSIKFHRLIEEFCTQGIEEHCSIEDSYRALGSILKSV